MRPPASVAQLLELQHERARLTAQTAALPLAELRALDAISADRARVQTQRRDVAERLNALPSPTHSAFGRPRDPHAAERARLTAAVGAADQQINALDTQADRLQRTIGPAAASTGQRAVKPCSRGTRARCLGLSLLSPRSTRRRQRDPQRTAWTSLASDCAPGLMDRRSPAV